MISYCKITVMFVLLYFFHWDLGAAQWQPNHKISRRLEALMVGMPWCGRHSGETVRIAAFSCRWKPGWPWWCPGDSPCCWSDGLRCFRLVKYVWWDLMFGRKMMCNSCWAPFFHYIEMSMNELRGVSPFHHNSKTIATWASPHPCRFPNWCCTKRPSETTIQPCNVRTLIDGQLRGEQNPGWLGYIKD